MGYSQMIRDNLYNVMELERCLKENVDGDEANKNGIKVLNEVKEFITFCGKENNNLYYAVCYDEIQYYYFDGIFINYIGPIFTKDEYEEKKYNLLKEEKMYSLRYEKGELSGMVTWLNKKVRCFAFALFYERMTSEEKFKSFVEIFKYSENAGQCIPEELLKDIINHVPQNIIEKRLGSKLIDKDGFIEVLRGQGSESTEPKKAMSWTTDLKTAKFFAYRYNSNGYVVKGKVHVTDVIMIVDEEFSEDDENYKDPEKEIIVAPRSVKDIKKIKTSKDK